jgi:hypothetical protein
MERETEEPLFTFRSNPRTNIEKNGRGRLPRLQDEDDAVLFDDEETLRTITGVASEDRIRKAVRDRCELVLGEQGRRQASERYCHAEPRYAISSHGLILNAGGQCVNRPCVEREPG